MTPEEIKKSAVHTLNAEKHALELMIQNVDDNFIKAVGIRGGIGSYRAVGNDNSQLGNFNRPDSAT